MIKHLFHTAALFLTGAVAMTACSADEAIQSETNKKSATINADYASIGLPGSRVASTGDIPSSSLEWSENDAIGVLVDDQNAMFTLSSGTTFTGTVSMEETAEVKGYYPYSSEVAGSTTTVTLSIPQAQTQSAANVFNGTDQFPMVADASTQSAGLKFKALAGIYRFKIYNTGDDKGEVKSITVTPATGSKFAGSVTYDYANTTATYANATADPVSVTLTTPITPAASADADAQCAYMTVCDGATLAGSQIVVATTKGIYDLDLTSASGDQYAVSAGKVRTMLVNLSSSNVKAEDVPVITSVSSDMPVEGTTLTVKGSNLNKTITVKIGETEYTSSNFTVNTDGTELTLTLPEELKKAAGGKITLVTTGGLESSSASLLDSDLLIADFAGTYGTKSWGSTYLIDNAGATKENAPTDTYFIGIESDTNTRKSTENVWSFGLIVWGNNRMVTTDAIPSDTKLSDIEIAFEYYMLEDQPTETKFVLKYPDANSVTVSMPDLTKGAWHTCAITLDNFAKANGSTDDAYVDFTSTTYGEFYNILKNKYTDGDYAAALTIDQPYDCEVPLNFYMTNVRLRLKAAEVVEKKSEVTAELPALSDSDSSTTITDFE